MLSLLVIGYWLEKEFNFAVKEGCEETLENIKEGELVMVLMNSHLELVTTNRLITNFRSRFKHALNVKLALRFSSPIRKTLRLMAELLYVVQILENLPLDAAAPLLCAGVTVFTPMKDHNLHKPTGKKIGVVGLGGLGHVAVKFGKAFGHHVTVISTSPAKEKEAKEHLGADDFLVSTDPQQLQKGKRALDFISNTVSAKHSLGPILELLKVNGTMVVVGAPDQPFELPSFPLIFGKRAVKGSMIGGINEIKEMMDLCGKHKITCDIKLTMPDKINEALDCVAKNDFRYRFVIDIAADPNANAQISPNFRASEC